MFKFLKNGKGFIKPILKNFTVDNNVVPFDYETNTAKAHDILKVANFHIMDYSVKQTIDILLLSAIYKKFDYNLLLKAEKKIVKVLKDLDEDDLAKVLYSFSCLGYNSTKLNFMVERSLITRLDSGVNPDTFISILKSIKGHKGLVISKGLYLALRNYIDKSVKNFNTIQLADVFINLVQLISILPEGYIDDTDSILVKLIYESLEAKIEEIGVNKVAMVYFIIYGHRKSIKPKVFDKIEFEKGEVYTRMLSQGVSELSTKMIYHVFLANHFTDYILDTEVFNKLLEERVLQDIASCLTSVFNSLIFKIFNNIY
jgi:hypothetical protein